MNHNLIFHTGIYSDKAKKAFFVAYDFVMCLKIQNESDHDFETFKDTPFKLSTYCFQLAECGKNKCLTEADGEAVIKLNSLYCSDEQLEAWSNYDFRASMKWMMDKFLDALDCEKTKKYAEDSLHWSMDTLHHKATAALMANSQNTAFCAVKQVFDFFSKNKAITEADFKFVRDYFDDGVNLIEKYGAACCDKMIGKPKNMLEMIAGQALSKKIEELDDERIVKIKEINRAYKAKREAVLKQLEQEMFDEIANVKNDYSARIRALRAECKLK